MGASAEAGAEEEMMAASSSSVAAAASVQSWETEAGEASISSRATAVDIAPSPKRLISAWAYFDDAEGTEAIAAASPKQNGAPKRLISTWAAYFDDAEGTEAIAAASIK